MKALKVDFAIRRSSGAWLSTLLILVLGAFAAHQGWRAWGQKSRVQALQQEHAKLARQLERAHQSMFEAAARSNVVPPYAADAASVARLAAFPLDRVLTSLESARVQGVRLVGVEISANEATARAELEFADHASLLSYLGAINAGETTPHWVLLQAQSGTAGGVGVGVLASNWDVISPAYGINGTLEPKRSAETPRPPIGP